MDGNKKEKNPPVICVSGLKNSGKTALIEAIIPILKNEGLNVAVIKHHGHGFGDEIPDKPGSDTYRFLKNGAFGIAVYDDDLFSLVKYANTEPEDLIALFPEADLIIIEGAKAGPYPKILMLRTGQKLSAGGDIITGAANSNGQDLFPEYNNLICAVTDADYDTSLLPEDLPRFDFGDFESVAALLLDDSYR